jgi:hypothetical protein
MQPMLMTTIEARVLLAQDFRRSTALAQASMTKIPGRAERHM